MTEQAQDAPASADNAQTVTTPVEWYSAAPDEVKGFVQNKGWKEPMDVVKAYQNLEKFHGVPPEQIIKLPKDMSKAEDLMPVFDRLGRPAKAEEYTAELPEGVMVDTKRLEQAKAVAHKLGLTKSQFDALAKFDAEYFTGVVTESTKQTEQKQAAELTALKKEWGEAGFSERSELARRFVAANMPEGINKEEALGAIETAIGTAAMLKLFANAGDKFREAKVPDSGENRPFGYTKEQAAYDKKQLMGEITADPKRLDAYNRGAGADIEKMNRLNKIIAG